MCLYGQCQWKLLNPQLSCFEPCALSNLVNGLQHLVEAYCYWQTYTHQCIVHHQYLYNLTLLLQHLIRFKVCPLWWILWSHETTSLDRQISAFWMNLSTKLYVIPHKTAVVLIFLRTWQVLSVSYYTCSLYEVHKTNPQSRGNICQSACPSVCTIYKAAQSFLTSSGKGKYTLNTATRVSK